MEKLYLDKNNTSIEIAEIANINSKEQLVYGNYDRDLILRAKGGVTLQIQNKFYTIPLKQVDSSGVIIDDSNIGYIDSIDNIVNNYSDGYLLLDVNTKILYFFYENTPIPLNVGADPSNPSNPVKYEYLAYDILQSLSSGQRENAAFNLGIIKNNYADLRTDDTYLGEVIFIKDRNTHYILDNGIWKELYINAIQGGIVHNNLALVPPDVDYNNPLKSLLSIPVDNNSFHIAGDQLNGLSIGSVESLKLYSTSDRNIIQSGTNKAFLLTTDLGNSNIYITGKKTSFGSTNQVLYADHHFTNGLSVDTVHIRENITGPGFNLSAIGNMELNRIEVLDPGSVYVNKGVQVQTHIQDSFLLVNYDSDDNGDTVATFRNTKGLMTGDLLLGLVYNKAKSLNRCVQLKIVSVISTKTAIVTVTVDLEKISDLELFKVGNETTDGFMTILDPTDKSIKVVRTVRSFSELQLPSLTNVVEESRVGDQNDIPDIPIYNTPSYAVSTVFGNLQNITDTDLLPTGYGLYSDNAYFKGKADLEYLKLGSSLLFSNGTLSFKPGRLTGKLTVATSTATAAGINLPPGVNPTTPIDGDIWTTSTNLNVRINGLTKQIASTDQWSTLTKSEIDVGTDNVGKLISASILKGVLESYNVKLITDSTDISNITSATYTDNRAVVTLSDSKIGAIYDDGTTHTYMIIGLNKIRRF